MKIAIFHDYFRVLGGAEKLVLILAKGLGADIITAELDPSCVQEAGFDASNIITLGTLSHFPALLPGTCMKRFRACDFSKKYDMFIFSGSFSIYAAKKHAPNMWYCHTPLRGLYDLKDSAKNKTAAHGAGRKNESENKSEGAGKKNAATAYSKIVGLKKKIHKERILPSGIANALNNFFNNLYNFRISAAERTVQAGSSIKNSFAIPLKSIKFSLRFGFEIFTWKPLVDVKSDKEAVSSLQKICANSRNVADRIKKFYGRESFIVNPPVDTTEYQWNPGDHFWLSVNRLTPEKRIECQIEAFKQTGIKLVIVGGYENDRADYAENLKKSAPENIAFLKNVSEKNLRDLYSRCTGFITTSLDEDFGMSAVEAMASGKPVIAPNEGGYRETVVDGKTGILIDGIDAGKVAGAVGKLNGELSGNPEKYRAACQAQAKKFDTRVFIEGIRLKIQTVRT